MGVVGLYYFAILFNRSDERTKRMALIDECLTGLERRVMGMEEDRHSD